MTKKKLTKKQKRKLRNRIILLVLFMFTSYVLFINNSLGFLENFINYSPTPGIKALIGMIGLLATLTWTALKAYQRKI